jgi:hypothetical protein
LDIHPRNGKDKRRMAESVPSRVTCEAEFLRAAPALGLLGTSTVK